MPVDLDDHVAVGQDVHPGERPTTSFTHDAAAVGGDVQLVLRV
jgi:hypothetical protein